MPIGKLQIRPLQIDDLHLCESYGRAFHAERDVPGDFSIDLFLRNWRLYLTNDIGCVIGLWDDTVLVGGIGGIICPDLTTGIMTAVEFFLYIDPEYRKGARWIELVHEFRAWAKAKGALRFRPSVTIKKGVEFDRVVKVLIYKYEKMGVRPVEIAFDGPI